MTYHFCSKFSLFLMMLVTILFGFALSVEARATNRSVSFNSDFVAISGSAKGNEDRRKKRRLTATMSRNGKSSIVEGDDSSSMTSVTTDDEIPSAPVNAVKGSIASRTSSVDVTKEDSSVSPESMGIHFVKPNTAGPSGAPPNPSIATNSPSMFSSTLSTKKSTITVVSSPTAADASPTRTAYPTMADLESIASRTSTMDGLIRLPKSAKMEFDQAETASPIALKPKSNNSSSTTEEGGDHILSSNANINHGDSPSTFSTKNSSSSAAPLVFPREKDQPEKWPEFVGGIFVVGAIGFFGVTIFKNYQKRKDYQDVPISLTV